MFGTFVKSPSLKSMQKVKQRTDKSVQTCTLRKQGERRDLYQQLIWCLSGKTLRVKTENQSKGLTFCAKIKSPGVTVVELNVEAPGGVAVRVC